MHLKHHLCSKPSSRYFCQQHLSSIKEYGGSLTARVSDSSRFIHYRCCEEYSVGVLGNIRPLKNNGRGVNFQCRKGVSFQCRIKQSHQNNKGGYSQLLLLDSSRFNFYRCFLEYSVGEKQSPQPSSFMSFLGATSLGNIGASRSFAISNPSNITKHP
jgi:hypothetical protein